LCLASKSACRPCESYAPFFSGFGSKPGSKSSITAFHGIHSQYRPKEPGFKVSGRLASMPWRTSGCAWCTSNYGSTCNPNEEIQFRKFTSHGGYFLCVLICPTSAKQGRFLKVYKSAKRAPILDLRLGRLWEERRASAGALSYDQIAQSSSRATWPS